VLRNDEFRWTSLVGPRAIALVWAPIALVTLLHYTTGATHHWLHDIFRRLYYVPIILAAFTFGVRGSLLAAVAASLLYAPHAFTHFLHHDPARGVEKVLEILLYNVIGLVAGLLADFEFRARRRSEKNALDLAAALEEKTEMENLLVRAGRLQAMGEMTAGLAHEIKNPLASIQASAEVVAEDIPPDSPKRAMADILMKELARLQRTLERFLDFARPDAVDSRPVDLCEILHAVHELVGAQARQSDVAMELTTPGQPLRALGEREKIVQVVMNLMLNAMQAAGEGGRVALSCGRTRRGRREYAAITVADNGPGVPEVLREKIFNPFFTTKDKGSGLGLAIASQLVDQHEGFIEITERPGGGASFAVHLPLVE
jgi:signal transduction histidine kinase